MQRFGKNESQTGRLCLSAVFFGMLAGGNLNEFLVGEIIKNLPDGVSEIMTHPGMDAESLEKTFSWQYHWEDELNAFLSEKINVYWSSRR